MYESLYDYLSDTVAEVPAGSGGVIFTPWLHGNRCPFEAPDAAGMVPGQLPPKAGRRKIPALTALSLRRKETAETPS